jgi:hypothetical protein
VSLFSDLVRLHLRKAVGIGDDDVRACCWTIGQRVFGVCDNAARAELLKNVVFCFPEYFTAILARSSVCRVDSRSWSEQLFRFPIGVGEGPFEIAILGCFATVNLAVEDFLLVDLCVLITIGATALSANGDRFTMLGRSFLLDYVDRAGSTLEIGDVLGRLGSELRLALLGGFGLIQPDDEIGGFVRILGGPEDFVLVLL